MRRIAICISFVFMVVAYAKEVVVLQRTVLPWHEIDGLRFSEISDAAYDMQRRILYMVSDEGKLFAFRAKITKRSIDLTPLAAAEIRKRNGKAFKKWAKDSEGLAIDAKGRLYVSFEGKAKICRIAGVGKKMGRCLKKYKLPKLLRKTKHYRSKNKSLEALAWHPVYGLLTVAEWPLKRDDKKLQTIYSLRGKKWHFRAEPEPRSGVTAIEVEPDGNVLVLERSFVDFFSPFVVTLKRVKLSTCRKQKLCSSEVLLKMNTHKGWDIDNFEGLARVGKDRYLLVSDDNDNFYQQTLLFYIEVKR